MVDVRWVALIVAACASKGDEDAVEKAPKPNAQAAALRVSNNLWDTTIERSVPAGDESFAQDIVYRFVAFCARRDRHHDTWTGLSNVTIGQDDVLDGVGTGELVRMWTIQAKFPDDWKFEVLRGNTLWYTANLDGKHLASTKRGSGDVCGLPDNARTFVGF